MQSADIQPSLPQEETIIENKELSLLEALLPVILLVGMLAYNIFVFGDASLEGSNQFILLLGAAIAAIVGFRNKVSYAQMIEEVAHNVKSTTGAILILLLVGSLAGTWMLSGVIPSMIYYGLQILSPSVFLAASVIICAIVSLATGSSWSTSATVGIALIAIGKSMGISEGMTAGAVISGAYFGDKISPLSDTTNLASAIAGSSLFDHIKYMLITTIPTFTITILFFVVMGFNISNAVAPDISDKLTAIDATFYISPWLFLVPAAVIFLIIKKTEPLVALLIGALVGGLVAIIAQPDLVAKSAGVTSLDFNSAYRGVMNSLTVKTTIETSNASLTELFTSKGMQGMLGTIWLIICAMVYGGVMDAIGALAKISKSLLELFHTTFGLFASTVFSCITLNVTASDQYLAIVIPGKMYKLAFDKKGLHPVNLSRTLEDAGTVTSVLVPWNTCGAYNASVLGVPTMDYFVYAIFNWLSPFTTLVIAFIKYKIKTLRA